MPVKKSAVIKYDNKCLKVTFSEPRILPLLVSWVLIVILAKKKKKTSKFWFFIQIKLRIFVVI